MPKVIILSNRYLDFTDDNGNAVKGRSIRFIEGRIVQGELVAVCDDKSCKLWIKPEQKDLEMQARSLLPGEVVELVYSVEGRRAVLSGINSTGIIAVDFDEIFKKGE